MLHLRKSSKVETPGCLSGSLDESNLSTKIMDLRFLSFAAPKLKETSMCSYIDGMCRGSNWSQNVLFFTDDKDFSKVYEKRASKFFCS